jgi:SulP family sulfate permease
MIIGQHKFDRLEFAGSLGDLGTLIPLTVAMILINGLSATTVFLMVGVFYIGTGLYFKLPIPVQPLKVVAAISIASPLLVTESVLMATGILMGVLLLFLAFTGIIDWLARIFTKPIIRGIQLGLGFILLTKGINFIIKSELFINTQNIYQLTNWLSTNTLIGILAVVIVILLISNKKFPAALVIVTAGILIGIGFGSWRAAEIAMGPVPVRTLSLNSQDFINAFFLLVIPQIPLTIGNAILGTADACQTYFQNDKNTKKVTPRNLSLSMGMINILIGFFGGIPLCHGAGGLAAHYRFGARTGGSNIMIGLIFLVIALLFGQISISLLSLIPNAILGTLLFFAGIELALLIRDVADKKDLFIAIIVAGIGFVTTNMGIALIAGFIVEKIIHLKRINSL